jgi:hypothetical protein
MQPLRNTDSTSESFTAAKLPHYFDGVAVLAVYCFVHGAHVFGGDFVCEGVEGNLHLRPTFKGLGAS